MRNASLFHCLASAATEYAGSYLYLYNQHPCIFLPISQKNFSFLMFLLLRLELMLLEVGKNRKKFQAVLFRCLKTGELHYERSLSWPAPSLSSLTQGILQGPEQKAGPADRLITPNQGHPGPAQNSLSAAWSPSAEQRHKPVRSGTHLRETHPDCRFQLLLLNHTISAVLPICSNPRSKITFICQLGVERYRFLEEN